VRLGWAIAGVVAALLLAAAPAHAASTPWGGAERVQRALFSAQEELILGTDAGTVRDVRRAPRGLQRRAARIAARGGARG
jgi:hypothetical protein